MSDRLAFGRGVVKACDENCGCTVPCPGGVACLCTKCDESSTRASGGGEVVHKMCTCGEHCGCNPCTCSITTPNVGKAYCKCGPGCNCTACAA